MNTPHTPDTDNGRRSDAPALYCPLRTARSTTLNVRGLPYHLMQWGEATPGQALMVMVHGWMDVGASFQFVVDALARLGEEGCVVAPDWRGFGRTPTGGADCFWFPDYLADLDALLDHLSPDAPIHLVGHSMGGNIAMAYAGVRPQRVRRLINLEGFGLPATRPAQAPGRMSQWLDELKALRQGDKALKTYDSAADVARRLMKTNPRLSADKAHWLATHWAAPDSLGRWHILGDPAHKVVNPVLYRVDEMLAIHQRITAPVLAVEASHNQMAQWWQGRFTLEEYHERLKSVASVRLEVIDDAGHMLHHDQPDALARLIQSFLG